MKIHPIQTNTVAAWNMTHNWKSPINLSRPKMSRFSSFIGGVMALSTSLAWGVSQCSVDAVPIQITNEMRSGPETVLSAANISDAPPHFPAFVKAVTEHVATRLAKDNLCVDGAAGKKRSLLQFVKWPLAVSDDRQLPPVLSLDVRPSDGCRISSPWVDIAIERKPVPWVRGVFRWSQRQLLVDQTMLAGERIVHSGSVMPLKQSEFTRFALDYSHGGTRDKRVAGHPIEGRVPPDILWLFRRSWQSTNIPFESLARHAMTNVVERGAEGYTKLVIALIDRCFTASEVEIKYESIIDVADLISLEQYKINAPIR